MKFIDIIFLNLALIGQSWNRGHDLAWWSNYRTTDQSSEWWGWVVRMSKEEIRKPTNKRQVPDDQIPRTPAIIPPKAHITRSLETKNRSIWSVMRMRMMMRRSKSQGRAYFGGAALIKAWLDYSPARTSHFHSMRQHCICQLQICNDLVAILASSHCQESAEESVSWIIFLIPRPRTTLGIQDCGLWWMMQGREYC